MINFYKFEKKILVVHHLQYGLIIVVLVFQEFLFR